MILRSLTPSVVIGINKEIVRSGVKIKDNEGSHKVVILEYLNFWIWILNDRSAMLSLSVSGHVCIGQNYFVSVNTRIEE